jgi:plasmid stability protein
VKTTLDLPHTLIKQVKLRALRDGQKLKDAVAELLRKGLAARRQSRPETTAPVVTRDKQTGLPVIVCKQSASSHEEFSPERIAEVLLTQEAEWHHAAGR